MAEPTPREIFISVDIEASGPIPGEYSMLSIGACVVGDDDRRFEVELKPLNNNYTEEALAVNSYSLDELRKRGAEPRAAMERFAQWVHDVTGGGRAVFVGFNAPFDWSFVNYYFIKFLGRNPFGHSALDIKSYYMGARGSSWSETSRRRMERRFLPNERPLQHKALVDAIEQATIFEKLLESKKSI
jgi:ribonuclease T